MTEETYDPLVWVRPCDDPDAVPSQILRANFDPSKHVRCFDVEVKPVADDDDSEGSDLELSDPVEEREFPRVGDLVQWESQGALQLPEAAVLARLDEAEGELYGFIEGSDTGIPFDQLVLVERAEDTEE